MSDVLGMTTRSLERLFSPSVPAILIVGLIGASTLTIVILSWQRQRTGQNDFVAEKLLDPATRKDGEVMKSPDIPPGWWKSEAHFDNEKRAIFAKMPLAVAHASMFRSPGSYHVIDHPAGLPLFLVLGKDRVLRGFHNVCRHRAYPVISTKRAGCTPILACKYHGWTYNLQGDLIKAPKFDEVEGFRKDQNSLYEVGVRIDNKGVVFVDLNSTSGTGAQVDDQRFSTGHLERWEVEGSFNWKLAELEDTTFLLNPPPKTGILPWKRTSRSEIVYARPSILSESVTLPEHGVQVLIMVIPSSSEKCKLQCTLWAGSATLSSSLVQHVKSEIAQGVLSLEKHYLRIVNSGASAPSTNDAVLLERLESHLRLEQSTGGKKWPTPFGRKEGSSQFNAAESLCRQLELNMPNCGKQGMKACSEAISW